MKRTDIYDAISGIDEKFCTDSENFDDIAKEFKHAKVFSMGKIISFAACLAVSVIAGINIYDMDIFNKEGLIKPSYQEESSYVTENITENKPTTSVSSSDKSGTSNNITAETTLSDKGTSSNKTTAFSSADTETTVKVSHAVTETGKPVTSVPDTKPAVTGSSKPEITEMLKTTKLSVNTTETSAAATGNTDTSETTNPTDTIHNKPGVTDTTESTDVTANSKPGTDVTTKSTARTTKNTGTSASTDNEVPGQKPTETTISQRYYICDFENNYYQATNDTVDSALIVGYFGEAYANGYDPETGTHYNCKVRVYEIKDQPAHYMIAVHFEDQKEFFIYVNCE